ncbi:DUF1350 family protein [Leptothoe kymatousa]|uniref:DUF1350 family protein n=1 Tax=Leptothoe kymatousa TAU-MAC 1615 TaxID=2364775 RepID=A0ABS5Y9C6_9CYAN|nr:DUF1350 family protein [Leptothoe kymatousa]MBT9313555.1 DUF1350 family protein [Leptothoe kymatousa TAU-MAC 1615]
MNWQEVAGNWLLVPPNPVGIIHFLGGAFVAAAPSVTYGWLLENLYHHGYIIVATPFINTFDHGAIATEVLTTFDHAMIYLRRQVIGDRHFPIYGMGHSMGCKVHLLIASLYRVDRVGNILISFNNYPARKSIPLLEQFVQFAPDFDVEFTPSPIQTLDLVRDRYTVGRNLLIKFRKDTIDQTYNLSDVLHQRFPQHTAIQILKGTHTTPIAQDVRWQPGSSFTAFDAIGQFVKQEFYRDLEQLKETVVRWLG